jgi:chorismate synthase
MNDFGKLFRVSIFGESHGGSLGVVIDGCPAGLPLMADDLAADIDRRRGEGPGVTARRESDRPEIASGLFNGRTTGAPLMIVFRNEDARSGDYAFVHDTPRPGHADRVASVKFGGWNDPRGGGHFSGRLTLPLVAAGAVARKLLSPARIEARLMEAGGSADIETAVRTSMESEDSVGGLIECRVQGLPTGLGEPFFDSVESLLGHVLFAIPGIKGIEFGAGFTCAGMRGSQCNDPLTDARGTTATNHDGGVNGGVTNGNELLFRLAVRPASSIGKEQSSFSLQTGRIESFRVPGRHDACIALRAPVVVEAAAAVVLADLMLLEQMISRRCEVNT